MDPRDRRHPIGYREGPACRLARGAKVAFRGAGVGVIRNRPARMSEYPAHLASTVVLANGAQIVVRPIRPEDANIEQAFVRALSDESRYYRFMDMLRELSPSMLAHLTQIDYRRHLALIAVTQIAGRETQIAVGRYIAMGNDGDCEFAIVVADDWQRCGVATVIMQRLIDAARANGMRRMMGEVLSHNQKMLRFVAGLGFSIAMDAGDATLMRVTKDL